LIKQLKKFLPKEWNAANQEGNWVTLDMLIFKRIDEVVEKNPELSIQQIMGLLMKEFRGKVDGQICYEYLVTHA